MRCRAPGPAHLLGCPAASGRTLGRRGQAYTCVGPLALLPFSLHSYLSLLSVCPGCKFMLQRQSAEIWKSDPQDTGRGWY